MKNRETIKNIFVGVDIQNDFIDGSLAVDGGEQVITPANDVANAIRTTGGSVAWTRDWHPEVTPHFADYGGVWPTHCVAETEGAAFHPDLEIQPNDIILSKGMGQTDGYSGWEGRSDEGITLETLITPEQAERVRVFIGGLATDYCVKATGLDVARTFSDSDHVRTYLLRDAVRAVNLERGDDEKALDEMRRAGVIEIDSQDAIAMITGENQ